MRTRIMRPRTICGMMAALLMSALPGAAADNESWDRLNGLRIGEPITVVAEGFREHKGAFTAVSPDALSLRVNGKEVGIERSQVLRVSSRAGSKRLRNAAIGAGIGVAVGLTLDRTLGAALRNEGNRDNIQSLMWIGPIAAFGGLGAALPSHSTIYRAPKR